MEVFVARQPIYDCRKEIVCYDLLYRKDSTNAFPYIDGDQATAEVIINTFLNIGLERLTGGKQVGIHFTEKLLREKLPTYFDPANIVVNISQDVTVTKEMLDIFQELKSLGYSLVINESLFYRTVSFSYELLQCVDLIKVDFRKEISPKREKLEKIALKYNLDLMAEKIETLEAFEEAKKKGYIFFQGFLFSEPIIEATYEVPTTFTSYYHEIDNRLLDDLDVNELTELIEKDLSFSIKLLRLINTNLMEKNYKVCSIKQAISVLGVNEIKKWIHLLAARKLTGSQINMSENLTKLTLTRAKLCETIAKQKGTESSCYYMAGLISTMDEVVSRSMEEILEDLPLRDEIRDALMGKENEFKQVLDLVEAVEQAKWGEIKGICNRLNITERELFRIYAESLNWTNQTIQAEKLDENGHETLFH